MAGSLVLPVLATGIDSLATFEGQAQALGASGLRNTLVYSNTLDPIFSSSINPRRALDDGSFTPGPGAGGNVTVIGADVGFVVTGTGAASFEVVVSFFDTLDPNATPVNTDYLGGYSLSFENLDPGAYTTGMVDLTGLGGIYFPDDTWAVEYMYLDANGNLSQRATPLFAGGGPTVGFSDDVYWRDANGDGQYSPDEARFFGGAPNLANFYLELEIIPEPAGLALAALGLLLIRRR
jgi:hypothetical protein